MKLFLSALLLLAIALNGCTTRSNARAQSRAAFAAGQQSGLALQGVVPEGITFAPGQPVVSFLGEVRHRIIEWSEDLTLAQALFEAEYAGAAEPVRISIRRQGKVIHILPKQLLRGVQDPPLLPGDVVEIR